MAGPLVGVTGATDLASLPLLGLAAGGIVVVAAPLGHALSRRHERRADRFALRYCSEPAALASSLRRLGEQHLAEPSPSRMVELFWHSHPPLDRRLSQLANPSGAG
jgi:STE24 endopeptidase